MHQSHRENINLTICSCHGTTALVSVGGSYKVSKVWPRGLSYRHISDLQNAEKVNGLGTEYFYLFLHCHCCSRCWTHNEISRDERSTGSETWLWRSFCGWRLLIEWQGRGRKVGGMEGEEGEEHGRSLGIHSTSIRPSIYIYMNGAQTDRQAGRLAGRQSGSQAGRWLISNGRFMKERKERKGQELEKINYKKRQREV